MGACGLHTTVAELDQSSVSAIVATRVGTDYYCLDYDYNFDDTKYVINYNYSTMAVHEFIYT